MKKALLVLTTLLLSIPTFAQANVSIADDPAATREDILKLFDVMQVQEQMRQVMRQVTLQMRTISHDQMKKTDPSISAEDLAKIDARSEKMIESVPVNDMLDDMVPVYQKHLTKGDVQAMVNFYSTPTGQKILHEMPAITAEGMQALQPRMRKIMDDTMRTLPQPTRPKTTKPAPNPNPQS